MDKRLPLFLALAFAILVVNQIAMSLLFPPQPDPKEGKQPVAEGEVRPGDRGPEKEAADGEPPAPEPSLVVEEPAEPKVEQPAAIAAAAKDEKAPPRQWVAIGSVDPDFAGGERFLAIFDSRGASLRRLELASKRFRDLDDRSGYLGHLAPVAEPDGSGCRVRVVGRGTPAAKAGLKVGDVIAKIDDVPVTDAKSLRQTLAARTHPGDEVILSVIRPELGRAVPMPVRLGRRPLEVIRPEIDNLRARGEKPPEGFEDPASFLLSLEEVGKRSREADEGELPGAGLLDVDWEVVERNDTQVTFRRRLPAEGIEVVKRFRVAQVPPEEVGNRSFKAYHLEMDVEIRNLGAGKTKLAYRLDGPTGLPTEGWWYSHKVSRNWGGAGMRDLVVQYRDNAVQMFSTRTIAGGDVEPMGQGQSLMFIGLDGQFFASVLIPKKHDLNDVWFREAQALRIGPEPDAKANTSLTNVSFRVISTEQELEPAGDALEHRFVIFAGPKRADLLVQYGQEMDTSYNLSSLIYYGWPIWAVVARFMSSVLHFFYGIVGNYGVAIILLTVLVRGCMFPLSKKQAMNMIKMQELQPEMQRIAEQYKNDMEKRTKVQQELFRKHNYNPMGGCMLLFFQLPIFMGLYRALMVDVELRDAPLFGHAISWVSNLSAPDMLFNWTHIMPGFITRTDHLFGLGPYFNLLPLVTVGLFLMQQKMFTPPAMNEQAAMQQKMMKFMMLFIGIMFYKVASGLCLYFIASTLWGLAERKLLPKPAPPSDAAIAAAKQPPKKQAAGKASSNGNSAAARKKKKQRQRRK